MIRGLNLKASYGSFQSHNKDQDIIIYNHDTMSHYASSMGKFGKGNINNIQI